MYRTEGFTIINKVVVGITGMPGAGKGVFRRTIQRLGYPFVIMGDEVREEVKRRELKPNPENLAETMLNLRKIEGSAAIAKRCILKLKNQPRRVVFIDGIRSLNEVEEFKKHFPLFILITIHASPKTRYQRLVRRRRSDDPTDWDTFMERDLRELGIGIGDVISVADYMIVNEGTIRQLKQKTLQFIKKVLEDE
ncbi:AAA family ATPase [Thermoproteota archaeon]